MAETCPSLADCSLMCVDGYARRADGCYVCQCVQPEHGQLRHSLNGSHTGHYTHTHPFNGPCPGLPRSAGTRKVKPIWILLKQEAVSGSGISWAICKSAPRSRQITTPAHPPLSFIQAGFPSCRPTNSVKALKAHGALPATKPEATAGRENRKMATGKYP